MAKQLDVYLNKNQVGILIQDDVGKLNFSYLPAWIEDPQSIPISQSLPLQNEAFTQKQCQGFFAGYLPEENMRKIIARNLHISANNDFALLEKIGGECAGALSFMPSGVPLQDKKYRYESLTQSELATTIKKLAQSPLLAGVDDIRLSLAGAQEKMSVHLIEDKISLPMNGAPSTHILKPSHSRFEGLVINEAYCLMLADRVGLNAAKVEIRQTDDLQYLLVERYDRTITSDAIIRLHQEDLCQAMAIRSQMKYQNEGGPSLKTCFDTIRQVSDAPVIDLQQLLKVVIFNFIIGNHDAHAKNFSLLYHFDGELVSTRLAPFYDLISTIYYPDLSQKMAMKIGGEYHSSRIRARHFAKFAEDIGFSALMVQQTVLDLAKVLITEANAVEIDSPITAQLAKIVSDRSQHILDTFK